jgi:dihydroorotate dehydrogenase (NAD+) catalytic subunit
MTVDLSVSLGDVSFKNPVFVASGTFGYGTESNDLVDVSQLGAIVTKSITKHPREGNPPPRIVETPSGMINSIGLANIGVDEYIEKMIPVYEKIGTQIITNIAGFSIDDYLHVLEKLESRSGTVCGYEINVSCPNVDTGRMEFSVDPKSTKELTKALRSVTKKLLILKLSPNVTDIGEIAAAAVEGGADVLSAINTLFGMSIDPATRRPNVNTNIGGLSGPSIRPVGIASVYKISKAVDVPIIGIGGITSAKDVIEYLLAGASAVQVGTANFRDVAIATRIINDLGTYCEENDIATVCDLIGKVEPYD